MKKIFLFAPAFILIVATACKNSSGETKTEVPAPTTPANVNSLQQTTTPVNNTQPVITPNTTAPVTSPTNRTVVSTTPVVSSPTNKTSAATGMNPEHGQPGHRCDIPVGSPLNSKPAPVNTPVTSTMTPTIQAPATVTAPTVVSTSPTTPVAAGMNPAHGQPGHRCDIPVGSPLSSPPGTQPTINTVPATTTPAVKKGN